MQDIAHLEGTIHRLRAEMLDAYVSYIPLLDEQTQWSKIISEARAAGLSKDSLCAKLGCAWSTITRWMAGQTAPGPFHRTAIKAKLVGMLVELRQTEKDKSGPERLLGTVRAEELKAIVEQGKMYTLASWPSRWPNLAIGYGPSKIQTFGTQSLSIAKG